MKRDTLICSLDENHGFVMTRINGKRSLVGQPTVQRFKQRPAAQQLAEEVKAVVPMDTAREKDIILFFQQALKLSQRFSIDLDT